MCYLQPDAKFSLDTALRADDVVDHEGVKILMHAALKLRVVPPFCHHANVQVAVADLAVAADEDLLLLLGVELVDLFDKLAKALNDLVVVV